MLQKRSVVLGIGFGLLIVAAGLFFIFGKDLLWALYQGFFNLFGFHPDRTGGWEWLTTGVGVLITFFGGFILLAVIRVVQNDRNQSSNS